MGDGSLAWERNSNLENERDRGHLHHQERCGFASSTNKQHRVHRQRRSTHRRDTPAGRTTKHGDSQSRSAPAPPEDIPTRPCRHEDRRKHGRRRRGRGSRKLHDRTRGRCSTAWTPSPKPLASHGLTRTRAFCCNSEQRVRRIYI